jgi:hypothetical protein
MQHVRCLRWRGKSTGLSIVRAVPAICFLALVIRVFGPLAGMGFPETMPLTWCSPHVFNNLSRAPVQAALESKPGLHLVLVRYQHNRIHPVDWVQNLADINNEKIIWANDMGPEQNQELIDYFKGRSIWLVEPDKTPPRISLYQP